MKNALIILICLSGMVVIPNVESYESSECFVTLHSAELELTDKQINDACDDILKTGEAYIDDFRERGLIIKFITLGESITFPLPSHFSII